MSSATAVVSQRYVRFAGCCYLLIIGLGLFSETLVRGSLVVAGDAIATAAQVGAAQTFWRLIEHLQHRTDVQNVDLMGLAGFCRNCLADRACSQR